ncbi:hypothetical protein L2E82_39033 [Cichorium intybus]|uniref:Uncharacterized protein n=1 Tax=Cichorium intybus TaxID=13427 RepID=A0ACB9AHG3_CICIN|nr:hypothetical protein L2E82_39033 [Cichorium intybus]
MSHPDSTSPPPRLSKPPPPLHKHKSLSTDFNREETWLRLKDNHQHHRHRQLHRRSKSLITTEDINELKGCVDLGFHFASEPTKLSKTFPALDLYYATSTPATPSSNSSATTSNYGDSPPQPCSPRRASTANATTTLFNSGENPEMVKTRLKQWAQVVACAARQPACYQIDPKD